MKISKEVKTALLAIGAIILFIYGYTFLKGKNLLDSSRTFYAVYDNVQGLSSSAPVTINGLQVGSISDISFLNKNGQLLVTMQVSNDFEFSKNSVAKISSSSLLGGKNMVIDIRYDGTPAESGDTLTGKVEAGLLESMGGQLEPLQHKVESAVVSADSLITSFNKVMGPDTRKGLKASIESFKNAAHSLDKLLAENDEKLSRAFTNLDEMAVNFNKISDTLAQVEINTLVKSLEGMVSDFNEISGKINRGEGTLGKFINDEQVYVNLENATKQLEELLQDIKLNPKRYVHFSVFGKKAGEYEPPEDSGQ